MGLLRAVRPWDQWIAGWGFDMTNGEPDLSDDGRARPDPDPGRRPRPAGRASCRVRPGTSTRRTPPTTRSGGCSAAATPCTGTRRAAAWAPTPAMQDAFNLAWKLAFVVKGHAGRACWTPTPPERAPVGQQIVARANQSRMDYAGAAGVRSTTTATTRSPPGWQAQGAHRGGRRAPRARSTRRWSSRATEFNAHGVELNQRYDSGRGHPRPDRRRGAVGRGTAAVPAGHHPARRQTPARLAGRRATAAGSPPWTSPARDKFTLLTGLSGQAWARRGDELDLPFLRTVVVGEPGHDRPVLLLAPDAARSTRPARCWSAPTATSPGGSAPPSGTTPQATAPARRTPSTACWPTRSTHAAGATQHAAAVSTQVVPITVRPTRPTDQPGEASRLRRRP